MRDNKRWLNMRSLCNFATAARLGLPRPGLMATSQHPQAVSPLLLMKPVSDGIRRAAHPYQVGIPVVPPCTKGDRDVSRVCISAVGIVYATGSGRRCRRCTGSFSISRASHLAAQTAPIRRCAPSYSSTPPRRSDARTHLPNGLTLPSRKLRNAE